MDTHVILIFEKNQVGCCTTVLLKIDFSAFGTFVLGFFCKDWFDDCADKQFLRRLSLLINGFELSFSKKTESQKKLNLKKKDSEISTNWFLNNHNYKTNKGCELR